MSKCKNCGEHEAVKYSKYTSGEFCSKECARAFSTKSKRKEINAKVSKTLTGTGNPDVEKVCPTCGKTFSLKWKRKHRVYCSTKCANNDPKVKAKISEKLKDYYTDAEHRAKLFASGKKGREKILAERKK